MKLNCDKCSKIVGDYLIGNPNIGFYSKRTIEIPLYDNNQRKIGATKIPDFEIDILCTDCWDVKNQAHE